MESNEHLLAALGRIERNQQQALDLQRQQFELVRKQFERAEKIQDRAEKLQEAGASMMGIARKALLLILPVIIVLIAYLSWLIFR